MKGGATHLLYRIGVEAFGAALHCKFSHKPRKALTFPEFFEYAFLGTSRFEVYFRLFGKDKSLILLLKLKARKEAV